MGLRLLTEFIQKRYLAISPLFVPEDSYKAFLGRKLNCLCFASLHLSRRYDGSNDLALVESYNPQTNTWKEVTPMGTKRSCLAVASLNGLLYAIGGYDGASCLNSVERYDPLTNTWTSVAAMVTRRRYVKVAVMGECDECGRHIKKL